MADQLSIIPDADELKTLPADGGPVWNRLVFESSPYLLQHAANPVDWRPWGTEAFEQAQMQDKPIFLSIGYATCHWCHVMEHESFEDRVVAELMNRYFICIKVDKEERPDIDDIYMNFCQAMTGQGGWPLTAILAPDRRPWFCGTYFPKTGRSGRPGMLELLPRLHEVWTTQRGEVTDTAQRITEYVAGISGHEPGTAPNAQTLQRARDQLAGRYDQNAGGFGSRPKFPSPHNYTYLLRHWKRSGDPESLAMVVHSLKQMRKGGIFDHVGFGFHRYSTDQHWLLPHFEKMLYDQATLAIACLEAGQASGDAELFQICREIFTYVLRDMTSPEGGFYSAEDADSEGVEGKFYVWTPGEVREILGNEEGQLFCQVFQIEEQGNFFEEATGHKTGDNIPHLKADLASIARASGQPEDLLRQRLERARRTLFAHRELRIHPLRDDKILTDWNGLMISALALGSRLLGEPQYLDAAIRAADFILAELRTQSGSLLKRYRKGHAGLTAHLDDYAFMIQGLIELYQACFNSSYLKTAIKLTDQAVRTCWNDEAGAFYLSSNEGEELIVRGLRIYDGAIPSGNSAMACNLLKLAAITGNLEFQSKADRILKAFAGQINPQPATSCQLMSALDFQIGPSTEIVLVGDKDQLPAMMAEIDRFFLPNKVVLYRDEAMADLAPYTRSQTALEGRLTAYVCRNFTCHRPTTDPKTLATLLSG